MAALAPMGCTYGCDTGDNSAIHSFHSKVRMGEPIAETIIEGEQAQRPGVGYEVSAYCPGSVLCICRDHGLPKLRTFSSLAACSGDRLEDGALYRPQSIYPDPGFSTREAFAEALASALPPFYSCRFRFDFGRYDGGVNRDFLEMTVGAQGKITTMTDVQWDE